MQLLRLKSNQGAKLSLFVCGHREHFISSRVPSLSSHWWEGLISLPLSNRTTFKSLPLPQHLRARHFVISCENHSVLLRRLIGYADWNWAGFQVGQKYEPKGSVWNLRRRLAHPPFGACLFFAVRFRAIASSTVPWRHYVCTTRRATKHKLFCSLLFILYRVEAPVLARI